MKNKLLSAVDEYDLISPGDNIIVAFSGGADSTALLHLLFTLKDKLKINLSAAHLNHCLRGEESDRDEEFVRNFCKKYSIPLFCEKIEVEKNRKKGEGIEEAARNVRYDFLNKIAKGSKIATAHTLSDNAETLLMNITRGSTLSGLCGIRPKRDNIIRPIIFCTREMTENYCRENGLEFVIDSTNLNDDCRRNYIRHNLIPELKKINPSFYDGIERLVKSNLKEDGFLSKKADELLEKSITENGYDTHMLKSADEVLLLRAVKKIIENYNLEADFFHINAVKEIIINGGQTEVFDKTVIRNAHGVLYKVGESVGYVEENFSESVAFCGKTIKTEFLTSDEFKKRFKINKMLSKDAIDCDKINSNLIFRSRKEGDFIKLRKRSTKTLKKLFNENGIASEMRNSYAVLTDGERVLWLEDFGVDENVSYTDKTEKVLLISVEK